MQQPLYIFSQLCRSHFIFSLNCAEATLYFLSNMQKPLSVLGEFSLNSVSPALYWVIICAFSSPIPPIKRAKTFADFLQKVHCVIQRGLVIPPTTADNVSPGLYSILQEGAHCPQDRGDFKTKTATLNKLNTASGEVDTKQNIGSVTSTSIKLTLYQIAYRP